MRYRGSLTIPAGTLQASPATQVVPLTYGRIEQCVIMFPPGQSGMCHLKVLYHEAQIFPTSPEEDFIGDDALIQFTDRFPVYDEPFEVELVGWSPGTVLSHIVYVDFSVEAEEKPAISYSGSVALPIGVQRTKKT